MNTNRRAFLGGLSALPGLMLPARFALAAEPLKISHQFPGGPTRRAISGTASAHVRHRARQAQQRRPQGQRLSRLVADEVNAQFSAVRKGALDMTLIPLPYAGGEIPELNIALMPGLVTSYEQGYAWKKAEIGKALTDLLARQGRDHRDLDLAGRRRRQPKCASSARKT